MRVGGVHVWIAVGVVALAGIVTMVASPEKPSQLLTAWSQATVAGASHASMVDVESAGPGAIAVGERETEDGVDVAAWRTSGGHTWTPLEAVAFDARPPGTADGERRFTAIGSNGRQLVIAGREGTLADGNVAFWVSDDAGATWERVPPDPDVLGPGEVTAVSHTGSAWLAIGNQETSTGHFRGQVWRSVDGHLWEHLAPGGLGEPEDEELTSLTQGGQGTLIGGESRDLSTQGDPAPATPLWSTPDGRSFTQMPDKPLLTSQPIRIVALTPWREGVAALAEAGPRKAREVKVVRSGDGGATWEASDPLPIEGEGPVSGGDITVAPDKFLFAVGSNGEHPGFWVSKHGAHWELIHLPAVSGPEGAQPQAITTVGKSVVVVGATADADDRTAVVWIRPG